MPPSTTWHTLPRKSGWIALALAALVVAGHVSAAEQPTLQDRLEKGLLARTPQEFAFLTRVVERIEDGDLPEKLVNRVFFWARRKADEQEGTKRRRPMIYFQPALTKLAERIGVDLT